MNANIYKVIFSQHLGQLVVVGENASRSGKSAGGERGEQSQGTTHHAGAGVGGFYVGVMRSIFAAGLLSVAGLAQSNALDANALPTGAAVQAGSVTHSVDGSTMNIVQSTSRAVVNYNSFNIGRNATVNHSGGVLLGRVTGGTASRIEGTLNTSGMVLVNPNGIAIGSTANINAGSFTASTFNISNDDFMAGRLRFERNGTETGVVNEGTITTEGGGYVALVGATVDNHGRIITAGGDVVMASGQAATISVPLTGSGKVRLELDAGALNAAVANHEGGVIITEGGQVLMRAAALVDATSGSNMAPANVTHMGQVDTTGEQGGRVDILADNGIVRVGGSITANSTGTNTDGTPKAGGDIFIGRDEDTNVLAADADVTGASLETRKGFLETSGRHLTIDNTKVVVGTWLLDPDNIDITNAATATTGFSRVSASAISSALNAGANVVIHTTSGVTTTQGTIDYTAANPGEGNILVSSAISKTSGGNASLTITADNGLTVNAAITASGVGTGTLDINLTANGLTNGTAVSLMTAEERALSRGLFINGVALNANGGDITLSGTSYANGFVTRDSSGNCTGGNCNAMATNAIGKGVQIHNGASLTARDIIITGVAENQSGNTSTGVLIQRYPNVSTFTASRNISITGTLQGAGNGRGLLFAESGWGPQAPSLTAAGNITLRGNNRASITNTNAAVDILSGAQVSAGGNIILQAETNNAAALAIRVQSSGSFSDWSVASASGGALTGNMSLKSTSGDVLIQSNQGTISLSNQLTSTLVNGTQTTSTEISGRNITVDNTGGTVNAVDGVITPGLGTSTSGSAGILIADGRTFNALNNINIYGVGTSGHGVHISGAANLNAGSPGYTGNFNITGVNTATSVASINISNVAASLSAQNFARFTSGVKASGNSLNVAGLIHVGAELQIENPNAGTISGVISGPGLLRKVGGTGAGTLTLTATNTYSGGTVANGGNLQVGNGGTTGSLGSGSISVASVLSINRSDTYTIADNISGVGQIWQVGAGTTVLTGTNTYSGTTLVNAGVLQVGNGGTTGTLGSGNVTLNNTSLIFNRSDSITANNTISGSGNVFATSTAGGVTMGNLAFNGNLSVSAAGNVSLSNTGVISFSARTTANNGNISLTNTAGTATVTTVNGISGVSTHGSGNITLSSTTSSGFGIRLLGNVTALGGDVTLSGTTSSTVTATPTLLAGIFSSATVSAKNITMTAQATGTSGVVLGYYGAGGIFEASETLSLTGSSQNAGNGLYSYGGRLQSATGMTLMGTSVQGNAVGMDANLVMVNSASGGISITASATDPTKTAVSLSGASLTNGGGNVTISATSGHITVDTGNPAWGLGTLTNTLAQNGSGDVTITTQNSGNITVPVIVNNGSDNVVIAAGSNVAAGTGTGGQVLTVSGNTITQNSTGKTFIYTGQASSTGQLSHLTSAFNNLYYQGSSQSINAQFNTAYSSTITGGADVQVLFREASANAPGFTINLSNISQSYGDAEFTLAARNTALLNAYTGAGTLTSTVSGANGGSHTFAVTAADVINGLTGTARAAGTNVGTYAYTNISGSAFNTTVSAQPSLVINPRDITLTSITAATKVYDGSTTASITGGTFGNIVAGETLALGGSGYFNSPNVSDVSTVTVDDVTTLTKLSGGTGLWSNYNLVTTGSITSSATGKITRAPLTATVNNSSIFVTQLASSAPDMGVTYSGFVNNEDVSVLSGTAVRSYTGAASYPAAGTHAGVFGLSQTPTAANYQITVVSGDLTVIPADKLLITIQSQAAEYGSQTAANLGAAGATTVSAQYCLDQNDCNGGNLVDLTLSKLTETRWKAEDNTGSYVVFDTSVLAPSYSTGGYLEVGNYNFDASEITPLSLFTNGQPNFTGRAVNAGVLTINARDLTITAANEDQLFTGSMLTQTLRMQGLLAGDDVDVNGLAQGTAMGSYMSNLVVSGVDRPNYRLILTNGTLRIVAQQRPNRPGRVDPQNPTEPVIPAGENSGSSQASASLAGGSNPFQLASTELPDLMDPKCNLEDLTNCRCDPLQPADMQRSSVEIETTQVCYQPVN